MEIPAEFRKRGVKCNIATEPRCEIDDRRNRKLKQNPEFKVF